MYFFIFLYFFCYNLYNKVVIKVVKINIPDNIRLALEIIQTKGEAYIVGGCVRDNLLNIEPNDYDITTNLLPDEVIDLFGDYKIINNNGLKHGTVSIMINDQIIEVTTFRTEGSYLDGRHPSSVSFTKSLKEDLMRRDFTINAMAYNDKVGLVDYYDGKLDLKNKIIRTVRDPYQRFEEDYLRILRALRFKSKLSFKIEDETKKAMLVYANNLVKISYERVFNELKTIMLANEIDKLIIEFLPIFLVIFPELSLTINFDQKSKWHSKKLFDHLIGVCVNTPCDLALRLAALFHDIGKATCYQEEIVNGCIIRHFAKHNEESTKITRKILERLKVPNELKEEVLFLVFYHDYAINSESSIKRILIDIKDDKQIYYFNKLLLLKKADYSDHTIYDEVDYDKYSKMAEDIVFNSKLIKIKDLAINGYDLMELGYYRHQIKVILDSLIEEVNFNNLENKKDVLINYINESSDKYETN